MCISVPYVCLVSTDAKRHGSPKTGGTDGSTLVLGMKLRPSERTSALDLSRPSLQPVSQFEMPAHDMN